jgi:hypothetical protein
MIGEDTTGPLGVISIDHADFEPATEPSRGRGDIHDDATLAQALMRIAARDPGSCWEPSSAAFATGQARMRRDLFAGRLTPFWATSARVTANLGGLAVELEQAVAQVLRRIAASR